MGAEHDQSAPMWRCAGVWLLATGALVSLVALSLPPLTGLPDLAATSFDEAVVTLAGAVSLLVCPWLWFLTTWGVLDALRGRPATSTPGWWRRATMVACGCAATVAVSLPAHAGEPAPTDGPTTAATSHALDGLPYPDRPSRGAPAPRGAVPTATTTAELHLVRPGDTLWSVATDALRRREGAGADPATVARAVARIHTANREVVGADPDLILPGQRLTLDPIHTPHRKDPR